MGRRNKPTFGDFPGRIPYAKIGRGAKNLIYIIGGPGNEIPRGLGLRMYTGNISFLTDEYTIWVTARKKGQEDDYSTRKMAADMALVIGECFSGTVDVVMGISYGSLIAQYMAADFPGLTRQYILVSTGVRVPPFVAGLDMKFAEHLAAGRNGRAMLIVADYLFPPGLKRSLIKILLFPAGMFSGKAHHPDFATDVLKEARMEALHDARDALGSIVDPVMMIGGSSDLAFPLDIQQETAALIPGVRFEVYSGRGHGDTTADKRFAEDVRSFLEKSGMSGGDK